MKPTKPTERPKFNEKGEKLYTFPTSWGTVSFYHKGPCPALYKEKEVISMTAKPKTGKMTDKEILENWKLKDLKSNRDILELIKLARQQGIADFKAKLRDTSLEKKIASDLYGHYANLNGFRLVDNILGRAIKEAERL
jgi:hypothetical protein